MIRACLLAVSLLTVSTAPVAAYAGFADIITTEPSWTSLPSEPLSLAQACAYRVRMLGPDRIIVEVRNLGTGRLRLGFTLPAYQEAGQPEIQLEVAAGTTSTQVVAVHRADRDCTESAIVFSTMQIAERSIPIRPPAGRLPPQERAFAIQTTWEAAAFRPAALAYTAAVHDPQTIDLHLFNRSNQTIHADFAILGWQPSGTRNPRMHLLPGTTTEILVPADQVSERVTAAAVAVWAVRVGDDRGPAAGSGPADQQGLLPMPGDQTWRATLANDENLAGYNPLCLLHRPTSGGFALRNRSAVRIEAQLMITGGGATRTVPIDLPAGGEQLLSGPTAPRGSVSVAELRLAGVPVASPAPVIAAPPPNALSVLGEPADPGFNPLTIVYAVTRAGEREARVTIVNRAAIPFHGAWRLPAYQGPEANARLHLPAGAAATLIVPTTTTDVRIALAQLAVSDVRLGDDQGPLLCASPAAASP